jgi:GT2 family glycosyltransferase
MQITTIIVSYNTRHLLDECLAALHAAEARIGGGTCVVVDNASRDGSAEHLAQHHPEVHLVRMQQNVGFGRANNAALPQVQTPFLLLLNADAFVPEDALQLSLDYMAAHPGCGVLGARLVGRDGSPQPSARGFPTPWNTFLHETGLERWFPRVLPVDPSTRWACSTRCSSSMRKRWTCAAASSRRAGRCTTRPTCGSSTWAAKAPALKGR